MPRTVTIASKCEWNLKIVSMGPVKAVVRSFLISMLRLFYTGIAERRDT